MESKRKGYSAKPYESVGLNYIDRKGKTRKETNCCIYDSMLESDAFVSLKPRLKVLYLYCKAQLFGKRKPARDCPQIDIYQDDSCFYFNWDLAKNYGLYKPSMESNFYRDMKALIDAGFIKLLTSGAKRKQKNVYAFSDRWKSFSYKANKPC